MAPGAPYGVSITLWSEYQFLLVVLNHRDVERVGRELYNKRKQYEGRLYYS